MRTGCVERCARTVLQFFCACARPRRKLVPRHVDRALLGGRREDGTYSFRSRHIDKAVVKAAFAEFDYGELPKKHPMRYWAVAGWGPVPAVLRAPEGIYREMELEDPSDLDQEIHLSDWPLWFEKHHDQNIIFFGQSICNIRVGEVKWVAAIDVRDDTTVENLRIPPEGIEAIVCSSEELQTIPPPIDTATGREYIEMTSGEFVVRDGSRNDTWKMLARVGNVAVGKWFWEIYPSRQGSVLTQLVVWHESVDDTDEYKTKYQGREQDLVEMIYMTESSLTSFEFVVMKRKEALAVADIFLWTADAEPQLKHAMARFMTADPNSLWWKDGELPDGFLLLRVPNNIDQELLVGELRCEKLFFVDDVWTLFTSMDLGLARTIMGGCAVRPQGDEDLLSIQFKPSRSTGKIVAMRAVFLFTYWDYRRDTGPDWDVS